jgi:hypothetical protein
MILTTRFPYVLLHLGHGHKLRINFLKILKVLCKLAYIFYHVNLKCKHR